MECIGDIEPFTSPVISPQYGSQGQRLASYDGVDESEFPMPVEELADAGLYYTGEGDKVRCYWCCGELDNWEPDDDAWVEHARYE